MPSFLFPLENLFSGKLSRNHIENKFSILEIYLQCDFIDHEWVQKVGYNTISTSSSESTT